jgi:hypothetical protein
VQSSKVILLHSAINLELSESSFMISAVYMFECSHKAFGPSEHIIQPIGPDFCMLDRDESSNRFGF